MKNRHNLFTFLLPAAAALVLSVTLRAHASGGVMEIPPAPTPAPATKQTSKDTALTEPAQLDATDPVAEATLSLAQLILSLL